nr:DUF6499 domain-containing protein [Roseicella sp. DB1501]
MTASHLAWEWLRRNESYDQDFEAVTRGDVDPRAFADTIRQRWGLRFPGRSSASSARRTRSLVATRGYECRYPGIRTGGSVKRRGRSFNPSKH